MLRRLCLAALAHFLFFRHFGHFRPVDELDQCHRSVIAFAEAELEYPQVTAIAGDDYDWSLNDVAKAKSGAKG